LLKEGFTGKVTWNNNDLCTSGLTALSNNANRKPDLGAAVRVKDWGDLPPSMAVPFGHKKPPGKYIFNPWP